MLLLTTTNGSNHPSTYIMLEIIMLNTWLMPHFLTCIMFDYTVVCYCIILKEKTLKNPTKLNTITHKKLIPDTHVTHKPAHTHTHKHTHRENKHKITLTSMRLTTNNCIFTQLIYTKTLLLNITRRITHSYA